MKEFFTRNFPTVLLVYILLQVVKLWGFIVEFYLTFNVGVYGKVYGLSIYRVFNEVSENNIADNCVKCFKFSDCSATIVTLKFHPSLNVSLYEIIYGSYTCRVYNDGIDINISENYVSTFVFRFQSYYCSSLSYKNKLNIFFFE